jgi:2',3'-cyclic-nucleotide 2'-phosphodiesterase (5'-nucleotidase family)
MVEMAKQFRGIWVLMIMIFILGSCRKDEHAPKPTELGTITVDLIATENVVRKKEALIGNLICDAIIVNVRSKGKMVDLAAVNGGSIRFNSARRPDGVYRAGIFTAEMVDEMLPFEDATVLVKLNGKQLKQIMERSVAQYPLAKGSFLQLSKELKIAVDSTRPPQILNIEETMIISEGSRIQSMMLNNVAVDTSGSYTVAFPKFIADGNDGYVTLKNISSGLKEDLQENQSNALKEYIILNSPLTPVIENRIVFE